MHIILVSDRMATARSITLTRLHVALFGLGMMVVILALSSMFSYLTMRHAAEIRMPFLQELVRTLNMEESTKTRELVKESLSTMAVRLGQMQGQLMHLDTLGERLAGLAGVKPKAEKATAAEKVAPSGGPLTRPSNLSPQEMQRALEDLSRQIERRSETLSALEDQLFEERIRKHLLPTASPVAADVRASGFGWRMDPFTGQTAMHEGIDFIAEPGTPILAAAAGIIMTAERHPQYGNMVEIDHGNGLTTRYAHASALFTQTGELVKRGQRIAAVGSTGRSTGPHLHFEVRINGAAQNPGRFLEKGITAIASR
ncbi:MAG: peptidoglycan DD-metalloendopeptidase family protein [Rhodocyclaceae bacterium]|nr:peptidoglycan DD-metalloendopeptidase family protein [Rhodocyclaceae bacterium]MDZ4214680.1 peptidoglycan DD-metalloendopeptidase family protein [Rhodocyclaceae bacterium]